MLLADSRRLRVARPKLSIRRLVFQKVAIARTVRSGDNGSWARDQEPRHPRLPCSNAGKPGPSTIFPACARQMLATKLLLEMAVSEFYITSVEG